MDVNGLYVGNAVIGKHCMVRRANVVRLATSEEDAKVSRNLCRVVLVGSVNTILGVCEPYTVV